MRGQIALANRVLSAKTGVGCEETESVEELGRAGMMDAKNQ
jgi:hypothetical protein